MIPAFDWLAPGRIRFGAGIFARLAEALPGARRFLVATGRRDTLWQKLPALWPGCALQRWVIPGEPTVDDARLGAEQAREWQADAVLALGGGAVIDAAKSAALLATNPGDVFDYLEVIGSGRPAEHDALPLLAVPTTAGTGSEVTRNAVLASPEHGVKASLRTPRMVPSAAWVDPELTLDCPRAVTANAGLDAITQLIEPFLSPAATSLTDALIRDALPRAVPALRRVLRDPGDRAARADLSYAALISGLALSNAKLGLVHGIAGPLGGRKPIPHGAICARLLPLVLEFNFAGLGETPRTRELARLVTGHPEATPEAALTTLRELVSEADIPGFAAGGLAEGDLPALVEQSLRSGSTQGNPVPVTASAVVDLLRAAL
jgi:alcohol dehydrogenase class IV